MKRLLCIISNMNAGGAETFLMKMYRAIDKMIPKQSWYEGGYKANVVAYTTSLLHHIINKKYPGEMLDLEKIWQKQQCPDILLQQLTVLAEQVYYCITADNRGVQNVTQWCKQVACWETVKMINVVPVAGFESLLQGREVIAAERKEARTVRKIENTIDDQKQVFELGEEYWKRLEIWLRSHPLATVAEQKALKFATAMSRGMFPDDRQCKSLIKLRERAVQEGFPKTYK